MKWLKNKGKIAKPSVNSKSEWDDKKCKKMDCSLPK